MVRRAAEICRLPVAEELAINIVFAGERAMARINRDFVGHEGVTDVITFNYLECKDELKNGDMAVELVICPDVAVSEGGRRENSSYAEEVTLYIVHGFLHCSGFDDLESDERRKMRHAERRVMKQLKTEFVLAEIFPQQS
ncbi:MAG: rRNA maturation RNase YbeY [Victivallaceae bacterium]|jgi:probable rRNA maturation factor|nr:rRNA maturation RNase YbeY [Victivallaceae bacterium]NLK83870.1 rRNA maturation RNase YbeY [Lentisphaerota bacterium]MDD3116056.1 rRNA maturation RNase YbeY [Victivallaceae bacterium]MDD3703868.1 rRNA maturation RNase YbeY [Victivallaceae bacterium]MDD4317330.1 rRNA maturation RNase YbeY [Victivallaceae bacterium]